MAIVKVENKTYTVDPLYQWDQNQVLEIRGLSLANVPAIHFTNTAMDRAIVRQARMDAAGIITVDVPNSLLQKPYKITVFVCTYEGETFKTLYKLEVPVKARPMPGDYTFQDDAGEVYSYNALDNKVENALVELQANYEAFTEKCTADLRAAKEALVVAAEAAAKAATEAAAASAEEAAASAEATNNAAAAAAESAEAANQAAAEAAAEAVQIAILKGDVSEIVKVDAMPDNPAADVLYFII